MLTERRLTHKIIGCAMKVHRQLGPGFQEAVYQACLAMEMQHANIQFGREVDKEIFYNDAVVATRRADFIVEDKVLVELKAVIHIENLHIAQVKNYLTAYKMETGLLINFGNTKLQTNRIFPNRT